MAFSTDKTILDSLKRQADESIRNAEKIKRLVDDIIHKEEEKNKIEEEKNKIEEEKKKIEEENKKLEEEKKKIEEENKKLKEENKKLEEENKKLEEEANNKQKAQLATKTKTKTKTKKFDVNATSYEEELTRIVADHYPPVRGVVVGDLRNYYLGIENKFKTLEEAHEYYLETLKEKLEPGDVKYCGIVKMNLGYMLKPIHPEGILKWTEKRERLDHRAKTFITWKFDETCLE